MRASVISRQALDRRSYWVSEIVKLSGDFGQDSSRVERELIDEVGSAGVAAILDHLRLCGAIPESYGHDSSEEKLYSKYTDVVLAIAFRSIGLRSLILTERADAADVEVFAEGYSFVADAKAFRLSRTAKNQKDFKVQAMDSWKRGKPYAVVVCPLYQLPTRASQIYQQAITRDVCILSYSHLAILLGLSRESQQPLAQDVLLRVFRSVSAMSPSKEAGAYWTVINRIFVDASETARELWTLEKQANLEAIRFAREEALRYLAVERERIMRMSHEEALHELVKWGKFDARSKVISSVGDTGILLQGM
jgi:hypothetical protein